MSGRANWVVGEDLRGEITGILAKPGQGGKIRSDAMRCGNVTEDAVPSRLVSGEQGRLKGELEIDTGIAAVAMGATSSPRSIT